MSGKPSYAAVAAKAPAGENGASGSGQGEAPPPYSGPSHNQPPQTQLPPQQLVPHPHQHQHGQYHQHGHGHALEGYAAEEGSGSGWVPPPSANVAKSRALRRFWMAFLYAWLIWIAIGLLIGGGISDVETNPPGRHGHWDKHGDWRDDRWGNFQSLISAVGMKGEAVTE